MTEVHPGPDGKIIVKGSYCSFQWNRKETNSKWSTYQHMYFVNCTYLIIINNSHKFNIGHAIKCPSNLKYDKLFFKYSSNATGSLIFSWILVSVTLLIRY